MPAPTAHESLRLANSALGGCNFDNGVAFIQEKFLAENTSPHQIYVHQTCATNTENVATVFKVVRETLLKKILNELF